MPQCLGASPPTVLLLQGCVGSILSADLNRACVKVLTRNGITVHTLPEEPCCGAMSAHANDPATSRALAAQLVERLYPMTHIDFFISPIAGCGAQLKSLHHLLAEAPQAPHGNAVPEDDSTSASESTQLPITNYQLPCPGSPTQHSVLSPHPSASGADAPVGRREVTTPSVPQCLSASVPSAPNQSSVLDSTELAEVSPHPSSIHVRAAAVAAKMRDITEFLADLDLIAPTRPLNATVAYHDPCHLQNVQRITSAPRRLLQKIPGLTLVPLPETEICCGAAGAYNLSEPQMSADLGTRKTANILATKATIVATANVGCQLQIQRHLARAGHPEIPIKHVIELLAASYEP